MSIRNGGKIIAGYGGTTSGGNGDSLNNQNPTSPIRQVYDWIGTLEEYENQQVAELHPTWVCFILDDTTPKDKNLYTNRNVGDIFFTTRLDEILNGAVECNGASYNISNYTGKNSIGELLINGKLPYVSLSEYETLLSTNGVVGVFGWDGDNSISFRVPKLENIFVEAGNTNNIGEFTAAGLPNISGISSWDFMGDYYNTNVYNEGALIKWDGMKGNAPRTLLNRPVWTDGNVTQYKTKNYLEFDASQSNQVYGNSNTVQPKSVKYRPMVQLSIGFTDEAMETCQNVKSDVENLNNHALLDNKITNCITHIPQDIKLEINSTKSITIKSGTKCYIPNGFKSDGTTRHFDTYTYTEDYICDIPTTAGDFFLFPVLNGTIPERHSSVSHTYSGDTTPTVTSQYAVWYDTANNIIKLTNDTGTTWSEKQIALPIALEHCITADTESSIKQVFNGFGFIGKLAFTLPGVCGLAPNGRNEDGSLISKKIEIREVNIREELAVEASKLCFLGKDGIHGWGVSAYYESDKKPDFTSFDQHCFWYNTIENILYSSGDYGATWIQRDLIFLGNLQKLGASDNITELSPKKVFKAVDANEADYVIHYQKPTAENNYTWYRLYKSGWVEQGGLATAEGGGWSYVTLPIKMADTKATVSVSVNWSTTAQDGLKVPTYYMPDVTRIGILIHGRTGQSGVGYYSGEMSWQVSGIAA